MSAFIEKASEHMRDKEKYFMDEVEQATTWLRLNRENAAITNELAALKAEIKQTGSSFVSEGQKLMDKPEGSFLDAGSFSAAALHAEKMVDRYRQLLIQQEEKKAELAAFVGPFGAVTITT